MTLRIIGSSSEGNCYLLTDEQGQTLMIEAGMQKKDIFRALGSRAANLAGCIISHGHRDHSRAFIDMLKAAIHTYALAEVAEAHDFNDKCWYHQLAYQVLYQIGNFQVQAFPVSHDVPCCGFYIIHPEMGNLVFLTDTAKSSYTFPGINHLMVEANYDPELLAENVARDSSLAVMAARLPHTHMSIGTTLELLKANDLSACRNIILIHLSPHNSDAEDFKAQVEAATGRAVTIASPGVRLILR